MCNTRKSDRRLEDLGWQLLPPDATGWDGLSGQYPKLWVAAGRPDVGYHQGWLRDLGFSVDAG